MERTVALIVAAGQGLRAGSDVPKQFAILAGKPMLAHSHEAFRAHPLIDEVLVVIGEGQEAMLAAALGDVPFVIGGATRRESVRNGLERIAATGGASKVLIHDAARPFVSAHSVDSVLGVLQEFIGAIPVLPIADTIAAYELPFVGDTLDRSKMARVQTPQAFRFDAILDAHRNWPADREATDDAQMLRAAGHDVIPMEGHPLMDKVTWPEDFELAELRLGARMHVRTAQGFDVHRFAAGEELWLGGVLIPHSHGLSGHSDADVALHAITDALLGTIAAGDIGMHFPPSDPQWRGARSAQFLEHAARLLAAEGGVIDFIDLTLICEAPRIGPHREAIRASIAAILRLPVGRISVKATTTERLGFTGRGEGMAAQAIATVRLQEARS
ncbi:MAG: bifunctional 2-C-methyl-D-erythritol 4-phosphate cytidylyltransferase/2-C-methyl-D-erythritol 2,4-cyclodiphosphate synthase [Pseudomonadota bacterium]